MAISPSHGDSGHPLKGVVDVAIFTTIEPEEKAVMQILNLEKTRQEHLSRGITFRYGTMRTARTDHPLNVGIFRAKSPGNTFAAAFTGKVHAILKPTLSLLVGICAGLKCREGLSRTVKGVKIGDILVPFQINDFSLGAVSPRDDLSQVTPRMATYPIGELAVRKLTSEELNQAVAWRDAYMNMLHSNWSRPNFQFECPDDTTPKDWTKIVAEHVNRLTLEVSDCLIASSNWLLRDQDILTHLHWHDDRCRGADMESAGFASACQLYDASGMVVRCVSDHGSAKTDLFQDLASANAATFLKIFLMYHFNPLPLKVREVRQRRQELIGRLVNPVLESFATLMQDSFSIPINLEVYWLGEAVQESTGERVPGVMRAGDRTMRAERAGGLNRYSPRCFFPFDPPSGEPRVVAKCGLLGKDFFHKIDNAAHTPLRWVYAIPVGPGGSSHSQPDAVLCLTSTSELTVDSEKFDERRIPLPLRAIASLIRDVISQIFTETHARDVVSRTVIQHSVS